MSDQQFDKAQIINFQGADQRSSKKLVCQVHRTAHLMNAAFKLFDVFAINQLN